MIPCPKRPRNAAGWPGTGSRHAVILLNTPKKQKVKASAYLPKEGAGTASGGEPKALNLQYTFSQCREGGAELPSAHPPHLLHPTTVTPHGPRDEDAGTCPCATKRLFTSSWNIAELIEETNCIVTQVKTPMKPPALLLSALSTWLSYLSI